MKYIKGESMNIQYWKERFKEQGFHLIENSKSVSLKNKDKYTILVYTDSVVKKYGIYFQLDFSVEQLDLMDSFQSWYWGSMK